MMDTSPEIELSPLDKIRQTEAEVAGSIAAAREAAENIIASAKKEAAEVKRQARESGLREGEVHKRAMIAKAEEEARLILADAQNLARELRRKGQTRMGGGVEFAVNIILDLQQEEADP
jgi:vacuolar-type H+-ATPase subunit H